MSKRGRFLFLTVVFLLFSIGFISAANETNTTSTTTSSSSGPVDKDKAYSWLYNEMNSSDWSGSPTEVALSILALAGEGYDVSDGIDKLRDLENNDNWNNGDVKDTSLAVLALDRNGEDVEDEIQWLEDQHQKALVSGKWNIQLDSDVNGSVCVLTYGENQYTFKIDGINVIQTQPEDRCTQPENWINFLTCIKGSADIDVVEEIEVECTDIKARSSVIFETNNNEYYIVDESDPLQIENGCFEWQGSCDCVRTGYASWVLNEVGADHHTEPYLLSSCGDSRGFSFLYASTLDSFYANWLTTNQGEDGSWDSNLESTYLAVLALHKVGKKTGTYFSGAERFVSVFQNKNDGSWSQDIEKTAFILYSFYSKDSIITPTNRTGGSVCGNNLLEFGEECEKNSDCTEEGEVCRTEGYNACTCVPEDLIISYCGDGTCDSDENYLSCELDCPEPSDNRTTLTCDPGFEYNPATNKCEKKTSVWVWVFSVLGVILGIVLLYLVYIRYIKNRKKGPKGPSFGQHKPPFRMTRQNVPRRRPTQRYSPGESRRESKIEKELEESIKRARDILKK